MQKLTAIILGSFLLFSGQSFAGPGDCGATEKWDEVAEVCRPKVVAMGVRG